MSNDKDNFNNTNDEFVLNFDEDVIDLTNSNRNSASSYTSNINNYDNSNYTNVSDNDPYGAYDPGRDLSLGNSLASAAYSNSRKEANLTFKFVIAAMLAMILYMLFIIYGKNPINTYIFVLGAVNLLSFAAFLADSFVLKSETGSNSPIIIAVLLSIIYPVISFSKHGKSKLIPIIWLIAYTCLAITFTKDTMPKMLTGLQGSKTISGNCDDKIELLKTFRVSVSKKDTVDDIIKTYVQNPVWSGEANANGTYNITVKGDSEVVNDGELNIEPVTIVFKFKKNLRSFSVTTFIIGDTTYTGSDAQYMWVSLTVQ